MTKSELIARLAERFPHVPRIALTATADPLTRAGVTSLVTLRPDAGPPVTSGCRLRHI